MSKNVAKKFTKEELMARLTEERKAMQDDPKNKRVWNILRAVTYNKGIERVTDEDIVNIPYKSAPLGYYTEMLFDSLCCIEGAEDVEATDEQADKMLNAEIETKMWLEEAVRHPKHLLEGKELVFFLLSTMEAQEICREVYGMDPRDPEIGRDFRNIGKRARDLNDELCFFVY